MGGNYKLQVFYIYLWIIYAFSNRFNFFARRDVDIQLIVDVPWFVQFESNNSFLEDTVWIIQVLHDWNCEDHII